MRNLRILPYKAASVSAKSLANELNCLRLKTEGSRWKGGLGKTLINWGSSSLPEAIRGSTRVLNHPTHTVVAGDKLKALEALNAFGVPVPEYTEQKEIAENWINDGVKVVCRTLLRANSGRGIVLASSQEELVNAPLYVAYKKKTQEYRVHVIADEAVMLQRKARNRDVPDDQVNWQIRNHTNGFIFAHNEEHEYPEGIEDVARLALSALNLDFGAVDIIYHRDYGLCVLEVNTAPGLEGTTLSVYADKLKGLLC